MEIFSVIARIVLQRVPNIRQEVRGLSMWPTMEAEQIQRLEVSEVPGFLEVSGFLFE